MNYFYEEIFELLLLQEHHYLTKAGFSIPVHTLGTKMVPIML